MDSKFLLTAEGLNVCYSVHKGKIRAVNNLSIDIERGETFGVVGESGCGKSSLGRALLLLEKSTGTIKYNGTILNSKNINEYRRKMQIIFQDPAGSLDPKMSIAQIVAEGLHSNSYGRESRSITERQHDQVVQFLQMVGLSEEFCERYPRDLSGGEMQRVGIARALIVNPEFIVCDEITSALDVSYQAVIINLMRNLKNRLGLTYLYISHDIAAVRNISDRIGVMYAGRFVEIGQSDSMIDSPVHPYTKALIQSVPSRGKAITSSLCGEYTHPSSQFSGCSFYSRCPIHGERCSVEVPELKLVGDDRLCACHNI